MREDNRLIPGQWNGFVDGCQASFEDVGKTHVVLVEEAKQCVVAGAFNLGQRGSTCQEITEQDRIELLKPVQCLRIDLF